MGTGSVLDCRGRVWKDQQDGGVLCDGRFGTLQDVARRNINTETVNTEPAKSLARVNSSTSNHHHPAAGRTSAAADQWRPDPRKKPPSARRACRVAACRTATSPRQRHER